MNELRRSGERGYSDHGWLRSFHSFSFADYRPRARRRGLRHARSRRAAQRTHFLQIWIEPQVQGIAPEYEQKHFAADEKRARHALGAGRKAYVHVARGAITVNGERLSAGDALKTDAHMLELAAGEGAEVLPFDLP